MREIPISAIENIKIGNAEDAVGGTGCTVIVCEQGAMAAVDRRGGGAAARETAILNPLAAAQPVHAVLLSGGSSFGLDAAGGVMQYLEEKDIGLDTGFAKVPLVCAAGIFDLVVGMPSTRPGRKLAYKACVNAEKNEPAEGNAGAGMGATVGKYHGIYSMMKSGLGIYAAAVGDLQVGAVTVVNCLGDVYDAEYGHIIAGMLNEDKCAFANTEKSMFKDHHKKENLLGANGTVAALVTNGKFTPAELSQIAAMAQTGLARAIRPAHTLVDDDSVYALSTGTIEADVNIAGTLAASVLARAINRAVLQAEPVFGLTAAKAMKKREV